MERVILFLGALMLLVLPGCGNFMEKYTVQKYRHDGSLKDRKFAYYEKDFEERHSLALAAVPLRFDGFYFSLAADENGKREYEVRRFFRNGLTTWNVLKDTSIQSSDTWLNHKNVLDFSYYSLHGDTLVYEIRNGKHAQRYFGMDIIGKDSIMEIENGLKTKYLFSRNKYAAPYPQGSEGHISQ